MYLQIPPPEPVNFRGNIEENWRYFKSHWRNFSIATGLDNKEDKLKVATLLSIIGKEAYNIFEHLDLSDEQRNNSDEIINALTQHFTPKINIIYERSIFNQTNQETNESIEQYICRSRKLSSTCNYGAMTEEMIRDRLVLGIIDKQTKRQLISDPQLTLQKAIDVCKANESANKQIENLTKNTQEEVNKLNIRKQMRTVQSLESQNSNDEQEDCYSLEYVSEISARKLMTKLELELNGYKESIIFQIDTGATVNVLNFADLCKIMQDGNPSLKPSYIKLRCYGGEILKPRGQIKINCSHQSKQHPIVFQVIDHWEKPILSAETCQKLNLIDIKADICKIESTWTKQNNLLDKYKDIFEGIGCLQGEYKLETDPTIKPIKQAPRRVPITLRKELKEKLIDMEKKNIIAKVDYPTDWISNLVLVKSTKKLRICIDPRELNVALKRAEYPIPKIEEKIPNLQNAKIFTVVDTKDGFWNVKLSDESSNLTTFWTPFGRYKFLRMPFGLKTASEEYQRRLYEIFQGLEGIEIIADDILILGKGDSYEEALKDHDRNLENLFKTARQANLKFNINKVKLRLKEVKYLGHIITPHGLKPDPEKVKALKEMPHPESITELKSFLGFATYLCKFMPNISMISEPLRKLTMKNSTWSWSKNHQAAFEQIKDLASKAPILRYFDADKPIAIQCDASKHGLGATLLQESQPIIFASRSLSKTEQNYAQIEKECLAIVFACERFHQYCWSQLNHHTLLHVISSPPRQRESSSVQSTSPKSVQPSNVPSTSTSCCLSGADGSIQILLSTAIIHIQDVNGEDQICRALLDNGSQRSLITEKCAAKLGIPIRRKRIAVGGLGDQLVESSLGEVLIRFSSHFDHQAFETTALVLTKLTNNIPSFTVKKINYSHMKGLILTDPSYFKSREIDVILGSDIVFNLIQEGRRNGNENEPSTIHSKLGWLVYGPTSVSERQSFRNMAHFSSELESEDLIKRFWELESIPLEEIPTKEEKDCESHYLKNVVRDESGRYIVRLPFKESAEKLGQSKSIAISRFLNLEKRLEQNENIYVQYKQFMNEYIRLGHMQASCSLQTEPKYYIPHHCILKAQPNKLRVVFDASTKTTTQISLNDLLHVGPKLQNNIFSILLKFRTNSVALVADIEKMYRQIRLHPDDIKYQTILWRDCKDLELQEYNLLTVTYGLACAPYLAIRTLHQIAHEVQVSNPRVSKIIREDFYVDDLLTGCPTVEDAKGLVQQLIAVLGSGGFVLRKWVSNETSIIEDLPLLLRGKGEVMELNRNESGVNVLGIQWDPSYDTLNISCKSGPADIKSKRQIVSAIARIYDPCGWLSPTTVVLKLLLQELWKLKIGWDEDIPAFIQRKLNTFEREMKHFQQVSIPRCILQRNLLISNMQMHGFCDSSELAYSAVCYLRITYENNQIETILLTAKTKVAPIKKITIPRLELCAALMLAQLQSQTTQALPFNINEQFYWTDSKIVLAWITSESKKWQIFVASRVAKIQDLTAAHSWQYISGKQNPADLATRGILPSCLINSKLWWHGPVWLTLDGSENIPSFTIDPSMGLEERSVILHATIAEPCPEFLSKYSSFTKLLRVMAWCKRFINITRKQPTQRLSFLRSQDLKDSLLQIVKIIQRCEFTPEINACIKNIPLPRKSKLISLNIFIDSQGILRVGGRLRHSDLDIDQKHPMLIPRDHFVTKLIVLHYHLNNLHSGTQLTLSLIRNKFWIPSGRNLIKRVLNQCLVCLKSKSKAIHQIMGDLPKNRLLPGRPFEKIGIDLAGPIQAKPMLKRSKNDESCSRLQDFSAIESINWHFIPPSAPNFGGLWEAGIKSVKTILSKTMKSRLLNYEELLTLLAQIEACLNSRPLTFVSNDPNDLTALTPGHFLIGNAMRHDAESDHSTLNLHSRWSLIQPQRDYFWNRWSCEYLHQLQERRKWRTSHPDVNIGDLVMLKEQNKPLQWKLARIVQIFPGEDDHYILGKCQVIVQTDHKPLLSIFKKSILKAPQRLQRMLLRLQRYNLELEHVQGSQMHLADIFSRASNKDVRNENLKYDVYPIDIIYKEIATVNVIETLSVCSDTVLRIREETSSDPILCEVKKLILNGWPPNKNQTSMLTREYWNFREELTVQDGIIQKNDRIVIPNKLRAEMIMKTHQGHIGINSSMRRARDNIFWPGMNAQIRQEIENCSICLSNSQNQVREPMKSHKIPNYPWERISLDIFEIFKQNYLIIVDHYSDFFEVECLENTRSEYIIECCKRQFSRYGIPQIIVSDNGRQFTSTEFQKFSKEWQFQHSTSSPLHSQGNGKAEAAVKIAKNILKKSKQENSDFWQNLLNWRNTPTIDIDSSPVQRIMSRRTRAILPIHPNLLKPSIPENIPDKISIKRQQAKYYYDRKSKNLPDLDIGQEVYVRTPNTTPSWSKANITNEHNTRSYDVNIHGRTYRRNRTWIKPQQASANQKSTNNQEEGRKESIDQEQTVSNCLPSTSSAGGDNIVKRTRIETTECRIQSKSDSPT
ncbi:hypothetical protein LAZ67_11002219, partial [Cordylochernes scorpioides]